MRSILIGNILSFQHDPFLKHADRALTLLENGAIVIENGKIIEVCDRAKAAIEKYPAAAVTHYNDCWLSAGFIDTHVHFPQYEVIASYGEQLLEWLNKYTFPAEAKFCDEKYAKKMAGLFLKELIKNGVTTASVFCSVHTQSVDAFFHESLNYNARMLAGKILMDRNCPENLRDSAKTGYDQSKKLIKKWHGKGRLLYSLTPRFAPTSTPEQLEAAGHLWQEYPDIHMQTHLSENRGECAWVQKLFPDCRDYLHVYEKFGLLKKKAIFGHGIYLSEDEKRRLYDAGAAIAHCPTSNMFIGSGLFPLFDCKDDKRSLKVGLASDVGGGSSFSMFQTMRASYEVAQLKGQNLHPYQAWYLATLGAAEALNISDKVGNIAVGMEADIIVINPYSTPLITQRSQYCTTLFEQLFMQIILADERAIQAVYIAGKKVE